MADDDFEDSNYVAPAPSEPVYDEEPAYYEPPPAREEAAIPDAEVEDSSQPVVREAEAESEATPREAAVPDDFGPLPEEQEAPAEEWSGPEAWVRELLDYTRSLFGIHEEAVPDEAEERPGTRRPEQAAAAPPSMQGDAGTPANTAGESSPQKPSLTPESSLLDVAGQALGKAAGQVGDAITSVLPSAENEKHLSQPQEGPIKKMLREYVMGEGGMSNDERKQREAQTAANMNNPNMTQSQLREENLKNAYKESPDKGAELLQNHRVNQTNYRGLAAGALDSGKPSAREDAAKLFNEGQSYVPDGGHAVATPSTNGMLVSVMNSKTGTTETTTLTDNQFRELLHGRVGEFDHLTERSLLKNLGDLSRSPGMPPPSSGEQQGQQPAGMAPTSGVQTQMPGSAMTRGAPAAATPTGEMRTTREAAPQPDWRGRDMGGQGRPPTGPVQPGRNDMGGVRVMPDGSRQPLPPGADITKMRPPAGGFLSKGPGYATLANGPQGGAPAPAQLPGAKNDQVNAATRVGFDPKYGRDVRDADGWPAGVPRGGQFANTPGNANRDFSEPVKFGRTGQVSSVGAPGSKPVYDQGRHTYDVDPKTGLPKAQQGQPGYQGPQRGERNWNGTPGQITPQGGPTPRVLNQTPATMRQQAADARSAAAAEKLQIEREKLGLRRELGTGGQELKRQDLERKTRQGDTRIDQSGQRLQQGDRRLDQSDTRINDRREHYSQQDAARAADRVQKMDAASMRDATSTLNARIKEVGYDSLTRDEKALADELRARAMDAIRRRQPTP